MRSPSRPPQQYRVLIRALPPQVHRQRIRRERRIGHEIRLTQTDSRSIPVVGQYLDTRGAADIHLGIANRCDMFPRMRWRTDIEEQRDENKLKNSYSSEIRRRPTYNYGRLFMPLSYDISIPTRGWAFDRHRSG